MNTLKKILIILFIFVQTPLIALSTTQATQILNMGLPEVLEIEKIIVDNVEHERNAPLTNLKITYVDKVDNENYVLALTPIRVKIHTNVASPIIVSAEFVRLDHLIVPYNFETFNLSMFPTSQTLSDPFDHIISDIFTPYAIVKPNTVIGDYEGELLFTLGAL